MRSVILSVFLPGQNRRLLHTRGELPPERATLAESLGQSVSKLVAAACQMAELLDEDPPKPPKEDPALVQDPLLLEMGEGGEVPEGG